MYSDGSALQQLSRDECLMLMASVPVGRIIYTRRALPAVELVNFALDFGDIVIRTDRGGKLAAAARGAVVAFEADQLDLAGRSGWSVTAIGPSREVTDPAEIARLREDRPRLVGARGAGAIHPDLAAAHERQVPAHGRLAAGRWPGSLLARLTRSAIRWPKVPPPPDLGTCPPRARRDVLGS